jgi:hypothetical protein
MEVRTEPLEKTRLEEQLQSIYELCLELDPQRVAVSYGWACNLDVDSLWQDQRIPTSELGSFVERAISTGIFELGESDLHINGAGRAFSFTLCHESDLHFECDDQTVVMRVIDAWNEAGIRHYEVR